MVLVLEKELQTVSKEGHLMLEMFTNTCRIGLQGFGWQTSFNKAKNRRVMLGS